MARRRKTREEREEMKATARISRERLKRITKTRHHRIRTSARVMKYGTKSFVRNTWLSAAAVAIMAITLLILSSTLVATSAMNTAISIVESQVDISIYLKQTTTNAQVHEVASNILELESVTDVKITSPEEANNASIRKLIEENHITETKEQIEPNLFSQVERFFPLVINIILI